MVLPFQKIDIEKTHHLSMQVAREKAEQVAKSMKSKYTGFVYAWNGDTIDFHISGGEGSGVVGFLSVTAARAVGSLPVTPGKISIHLELPMGLLVAKPFIQAGIAQYMKDAGIR